jgi:hypothetical protein
MATKNINTELADLHIRALKAQGFSWNYIYNSLEEKFDEDVAMIAFMQNGGK